MKKLFFAVLAIIAFVFYGCGSDVQVTDISGIPSATAPVVGNSLATQSVEVDAATTGLNLANASSSSFSSSSSRAMCEITNVTKEALDRASNSDRILCYVKNVMICYAIN